MTQAEKAKRLRELLDQFDTALVECRRIAGKETRSEDWSWIGGIRDQLYGLSSPTLYRTVALLEEAEKEAA